MHAQTMLYKVSAVVPAQARLLGFSVIFAGQDLLVFQKAS